MTRAEAAKPNSALSSDLDTHPLSFFQLGIWWEQQLDRSSATYNTAAAFRVREGLDADLLRRAWQVVVDRHPALRTTFGARAGTPIQIVHPTREAPFTVVDASSWSDERLAEALRSTYAKPFDLERETAVQLVLFRSARDGATVFFRMHHILDDLGTTEAVHDELLEAYAQLRDGKPVTRPAPSSTYGDFVHAQRALLAGPEGARLRAYWSRRLAGSSRVLELPTDHPRPALRGHNGASVNFRLLASADTKALRALVRAENVSTFRALFAAYFAFLHRYTGQTDLLAATPIDCRPPADDGVTGHFVNMLVVRAGVTEETTMRSLVREVAATVSEGAEHKAFPFALVVDALEHERDPSRTPIAQTSFAFMRSRRCPGLVGSAIYQPPAPWREELHGIAIEAAPPFPQQEGHFELTLWVFEIGGELHGELKYDADLFERSTIDRMIDHFRTLLQGGIAAPDTRIQDLPLLGEDERRRMLSEWNATERPISDRRCVHRIISAVGARQPRRPAVAFGDQTLDYATLEKRSNQLARHLGSHGVTQGDLVAICLERSVDVVVAMLAILKLGAAFVPLDTAYPTERLAFMLEDCTPRVLLTQRSIAARFDAQPTPRLCLDALHDEIARLDEGELESASLTGPESLAYVIYTSGSTGKPKGVLIRHGGLTNLAEALRVAWSMEHDDRLLCFASFSFDACIADIFPTLTAGALLHLGDAEAVKGGAALLRCLQEEKITHVTLPPSVWAALPSADLPSLRIGVSAGEPCPLEVVARFGPGRVFFNNYGPTEITVCATVARCTNDRAPNIGRPIANTRVYVVDAQRQLVPIGVPGELYIGGAGVALGYLNRPELTAQRFVQNPFASAPDILYRTGDIVRMLPTGDLAYVGRVDHQVKLRGYRIELGEIENALLSHGEVREAAVVIRTLAGAGRKHVIAYVVPRTKAVTPAELRAFVESKLPSYMVPTHILVLDAFPLTPNGKVDRNALPAPSAEDRSIERVAPRDDVERVVAGIWCQALKRDEVSVHDDFFRVGGDSLLAMEVMYEVSTKLGVEVAASALLGSPTIAGLCATLRQAQASSNIVTLRSGGKRRVVCFHPSGGDVLVYRPLLAKFDDEWTILGVRSAALFDPSKEHASIAAAASAYADALLALEPGTPLALVGWSMGGIIAAEVARQLEACGHAVGFVALLDALPPEVVESEPSDFYRVASELGPLAGLFADLDGAALEGVGRRLLAVPTGARRDAALAVVKELGIDPIAGDTTHDTTLFGKHAEMLRDHAIGSTACDLHLWLAGDAAEGTKRAAVELWRRHTRGTVHVHEAAGTHYSMMRAPRVEETAAAVARAIADAHGPVGAAAVTRE